MQLIIAVVCIRSNAEFKIIYRPHAILLFFLAPKNKFYKMRRVVHLFGKALRETGQATDRLGLTISGNDLFKEPFSRHRPVMNLFEQVSSLICIIFSFHIILRLLM